VRDPSRVRNRLNSSIERKGYQGHELSVALRNREKKKRYDKNSNNFLKTTNGESKWKKRENKKFSPVDMKFSKEGMNKGMSDLRQAQESASKNDLMRIITSDDVEGNAIGVAKVEPEKMAQKRVIDINPRLDVRALTNLAYCFPLYAQANNILTDEMVFIGVQQVGIYWAAAVSIAYDLWLAAGGYISVFGSAPQGYWEIRSAISPTTDRGYKYKFLVEENFVGALSMYPGGFPLVSEDVSLAWVTNSATSLFTLANVIPVLTDADIEDACGVATDLWTAMATSTGVESDFWKMSDEPKTSTYTDSSAAFMANAVLQQTNDPFKRYCLFRHENVVRSKEQWLAKLGLCIDDTVSPVPGRLGYFSLTDFASVSNYMTRIIHGTVGKSAKTVIRPKYVMLEDIVNAVLSTTVEADLQKNNVVGTSGINMAAFPSVIKDVEEPAFLFGVIIGLVRKFQIRNLMGFDNSEGGMYPCTGSVWNTMGGSTIDIGLNFINEMASSMAPLLQAFPGWIMERNAVLVTTGRFSLNIYNGVNPPIPGNLLTLIERLQPDTNPVAYAMLPTNVLNLPTFIDPLNYGFSLVRGTSISTAQEIYGGVLSALQGNVLIANTVGNSHDERTLLYYTRILKYLQEQEPLWTKYVSSTITSIVNVYDMENNQIMYDLTKPLCVTFGKEDDYCSLYNEHHAITMARGELQELSETITYASKVNAHPIAGTGYEGAINEISLVSQHMGGGFVSSILDTFLPGVGSILGSILPI
jgi:hypothetical protein